MAGHAKLTGAKELKATLAKLGEVIEDVGVEALDEWSKDVRAKARRDVPIDTGNLGSAIEARVNRGKLEAEVGVWEDDAYYGQFVEQGTSSQEAQPFLLPAFERHRNIKPYIRAALERRL